MKKTQNTYIETDAQEHQSCYRDTGLTKTKKKPVKSCKQNLSQRHAVDKSKLNETASDTSRLLQDGWGMLRNQGENYSGRVSKVRFFDDFDEVLIFKF